MNTKKILLGGIAGGVAFFLLGWLIYGMLLHDFMEANMNNCSAKPEEEMGFAAMFISNVALALLFSLVMGWAGKSGWMEGAKIGAILGLLFGINIDLLFYSMSTMFSNLTAVAVDVVAFTAMCTIGGMVIGLVTGMGSKKD